MRAACCPAWPLSIYVQIAVAVLSGAGSSLTNGALFSNYLVRLPGQNDETVGLQFATAGIVMVVLALPMGWLADNVPRSRVLMASSVLGLAASALFFAALSRSSVELLYAASAISGAFSAASGPALSASFADALPTGARTSAMTAQFVARCVAGAAGPAAAAAAFLSLGNDWDVRELSEFMHVGNILNALSALLILVIRDDDALGAAAEGALASGARRAVGGGARAAGGGTSVNALGTVNAISIEAVPSEAADAVLLSRDEAGDAGEGEGDESAAAKHNLGHQTLALPCLRAPLTVAAIPLIMFIADFTIACGAGMTVAFFPLYFSSEVGLSPAATASVFAAAPLLVAVAGLLGMPLARVLGRAGASVALAGAGTASIFLLAVRLPAGAAVAVYLVRTAVMNATFALDQSVMMDVVAKKDRAKWASLDNLTSFTWTGSAVLGGYLVQALSFRQTFLITGCIYIVGTGLRSLIIPLTRGERVDKG